MNTRPGIETSEQQKQEDLRIKKNEGLKNVFEFILKLKLPTRPHSLEEMGCLMQILLEDDCIFDDALAMKVLKKYSKQEMGLISAAIEGLVIYRPSSAREFFRVFSPPWPEFGTAMATHYRWLYIDLSLEQRINLYCGCLLGITRATIFLCELFSAQKVEDSLKSIRDTLGFLFFKNVFKFLFQLEPIFWPKLNIEYVPPKFEHLFSSGLADLSSFFKNWPIYFRVYSRADLNSAFLDWLNNVEEQLKDLHKREVVLLDLQKVIIDQINYFVFKNFNYNNKCEFPGNAVSRVGLLKHGIVSFVK
ncbi:hypothetical protein KKB69_02115 [Patescibacteria group bacterium]|nr:hypothetical protein [Patescibacteria group bacterium]